MIIEDCYQFSMFDIGKEPFKIDKPIRLIELFAGIGSQAKALKKIGADFEHYRVCEFDKHAIKSYNAIHGTNFVKSDVTQITADDLGIIDTDKYCYVLTYSFPCQDLSLAGKQRLMKKGSGTRSSLLWEVERLLNECSELPQVLLMENVTQVHGRKNIEHFDEWIKFLESKGYSNYWQDLNAKGFGIPQNRNRTYMVSILGAYTYEFPKEIPLKLRLKDMLENEVDERFNLSEKMFNYVFNMTKEAEGIGFSDGVDKSYINPEVAQTIGCRSAASQRSGTSNYVSNYFDEPVKVSDMKKNIKQSIVAVAMRGRLNENGKYEQHIEVSDEELSNALTTAQKDSMIAEPMVHTEIEPVLVGGIGEINYGKQYRQGNRIYDSRTVAMALTASPVGNAGGDSYLYQLENFRIRKLTPKECFRLMGFSDEDFAKAEAVNSNTQLYKQAGNSIVVDVLAHIFTQLIKTEY